MTMLMVVADDDNNDNEVGHKALHFVVVVVDVARSLCWFSLFLCVSGYPFSCNNFSSVSTLHSIFYCLTLTRY